MMYQSVNEVLEQQEAELGAAEAHGIAVGMLTVESRADPGNWLRELLSDSNNILEEDEVLLLELFEQTRQRLIEGADEFAFDLFLPDDEEPLPEQVEALRNWCQGFLFGVGYARSSGDWPGEIGEVMRDVIEFTKIDSELEDEDDANALMEIREYLRAAVFTIRDYFLEIGHDHSH